MIAFLKKLKFSQIGSTLLLLFYGYLGFYLFINEPFDIFGVFIYLLFLLLAVMFWFDACIDIESSRPITFLIIEVEKWMISDYQKVYFVEQEYISSFYVYNHLVKKELKKTEQTKEEYKENNECFLSEQKAMKYIIECVKSYLIKDKREPGVDVKSIKEFKAITFDEVVALIEKNNAG